MRQTMPRTRWQRSRHALAFGLPLSVLQLVLYTVAVTHMKQLTFGPVLLDYLLAFLISAIAGYVFCLRRRHEGWESGWAGLRVGLVACVVFLLLVGTDIAAALIIADNAPPPPPPTNPRQIYSPGFALILDVILWGFLALVSGFSLFASAAGGRIGGALAIWRAKRLQLEEQQL
jgi:hypothetical protein